MRHKEFGRGKLPTNVNLYRVGQVRQGGVTSFWKSKSMAKSYQSRMGVEAITKHTVPMKNVVPSLSGSSEIWAKVGGG